jgi:hypothetical protein
MNSLVEQIEYIECCIESCNDDEEEGVLRAILGTLRAAVQPPEVLCPHCGRSYPEDAHPDGCPWIGCPSDVKADQQPGCWPFTSIPIAAPDQQSACTTKK